MNPWRKRRRRKLYRAQYVARRAIAHIHKKWANHLYMRTRMIGIAEARELWPESSARIEDRMGADGTVRYGC